MAKPVPSDGTMQRRIGQLLSAGLSPQKKGIVDQLIGTKRIMNQLDRHTLERFQQVYTAAYGQAHPEIERYRLIRLKQSSSHRAATAPPVDDLFRQLVGDTPGTDQPSPGPTLQQVADAINETAARTAEAAIPAATRRPGHPVPETVREAKSNYELVAGILPLCRPTYGGKNRTEMARELTARLMAQAPVLDAKAAAGIAALMLDREKDVAAGIRQAVSHNIDVLKRRFDRQRGPLEPDQIFMAVVNQRHPIQFRYQGDPLDVPKRLFYPHFYGPVNDVILVEGWQASGHSSKGDLPGWRRFHPDLMHGIEVLKRGTFTPCVSFNRSDERYRDAYAIV